MQSEELKSIIDSMSNESFYNYFYQVAVWTSKQPQIVLAKYFSSFEQLEVFYKYIQMNYPPSTSFEANDYRPIVESIFLESLNKAASKVAETKDIDCITYIQTITHIL